MKFCLSKFWKKLKFMIFASKFSEIFVELGPFSGQSFKICPKWLFYLWPNIILEKGRKFEKIWIIPWEMVGDILSSGCINPPAFPPASFRIKRLENYLLFQRATIFINSKVLKKKTKANQSFFFKKAIIKSPIIENLI